MTRPVAAVVTIVLALAPCSRASAGPPTDMLRGALSAVNRLLDDANLRGAPAELRAAIRGVLIPSFDARETARLALGDEWRARTPAERDELAVLLADHLERTYVFRMAAHVPMHRGLSIRYLTESIDGHTATVATTVANQEGFELPVQYRLIERDGRWAIWDVVIDGGSLVANYQALFARIIGQSSYSDLVALLKARASQAPAGPPAATAARGKAPGQPPPAPVIPDPAPIVREQPADAGAARPAPEPARPASGRDLEPPVAGGVPDPTPAVREQPADAGGAGPLREPASAAGEAPKPAAPAPITRYWLQVGAFADATAAGGLAARLRNQRLPVSIDTVTVPSGERGALLSRVRVGPFADRAEAAARLRDLQESGYRPFLAEERK